MSYRLVSSGVWNNYLLVETGLMSDCLAKGAFWRSTPHIVGSNPARTKTSYGVVNSISSEPSVLWELPWQEDTGDEKQCLDCHVTIGDPGSEDRGPICETKTRKFLSIFKHRLEMVKVGKYDTFSEYLHSYRIQGITPLLLLIIQTGFVLW